MNGSCDARIFILCLALFAQGVEACVPPRGIVNPRPKAPEEYARRLFSTEYTIFLGEVTSVYTEPFQVGPPTRQFPSRQSHAEIKVLEPIKGEKQVRFVQTTIDGDCAAPAFVEGEVSLFIVSRFSLDGGWYPVGATRPLRYYTAKELLPTLRVLRDKAL